jgi:hypothetical protein
MMNYHMSRNSTIYLKRSTVGRYAGLPTTTTTAISRPIIYGGASEEWPDNGEGSETSEELDDSTDESDVDPPSSSWLSCEIVQRTTHTNSTCSKIFVILLIIVAILMEILLILHKRHILDLFPQEYPWWVTLIPMPTLLLVLGIYSSMYLACLLLGCTKKDGDLSADLQTLPEEIIYIFVLFFMIPPNVILGCVLDGLIDEVISWILLILIVITFCVVFFIFLNVYYGSHRPRYCCCTPQLI